MNSNFNYDFIDINDNEDLNNPDYREFLNIPSKYYKNVKIDLEGFINNSHITSINLYKSILENIKNSNVKVSYKRLLFDKLILDTKRNKLVFLGNIFRESANIKGVKLEDADLTFQRFSGFEEVHFKINDLYMEYYRNTLKNPNIWDEQEQRFLNVINTR